jgi:hypothetical protein
LTVIVNDGIVISLLYPGAALGALDEVAAAPVVITKPDQIPNLNTRFDSIITTAAGLAGRCESRLGDRMVLSLSL